jgi:hypothetical protein
MWREYRARFLSGQLSVIVRVDKDCDDQVRYGLASFRWFDAPSFLLLDRSFISAAREQSKAVADAGTANADQGFIDAVSKDVAE